MKKRGISAVVATILIILIVVVGVGIVWKVVLPIFAELEFLSYSDVRLNIVRQGFTVYDPEQNFAFVQIERGKDEVNMTGIEIGFNFDGTTKTYQSPNVPQPRGKYTYKFNFTNDSDMGIPQDVAPDKVTVAPIFMINNKKRLGKILDTEDMPVGRIHLSAEAWKKANEEAAIPIVVRHPYGGDSPGVPVNGTGEEEEPGIDCVPRGIELCSNGIDEDCDEEIDEVDCEQGYFTFRIDTSLRSEIAYSFHADNADLSIDWGDGSSDTATGTGSINHDYGVDGIYDISLNGTASRIQFNADDDLAEMLIDMITNISDGVTGINSAYRMFHYAENFGINPLTEPAFFDDVSGNVTNMMWMFTSTPFNQDISNWDVSSVTNMESLFENTPFNQNISNWNTSSVTNMKFMFSESQFNQDISDWDVSSVTNMGQMFSESQFNQDISDWNPSSVKHMESMFLGSQFNQNISNWNTSSVTNMDYMFHTSQFNQDISDWDVSSVTIMRVMFYNSQFNQDISNWDVSSVTDMSRMFTGFFNQNISNWDVSSVTDMSFMFSFSFFNQNISNWDVSSVDNMASMFYRSLYFNQDISSWDVSSVTSMSEMFSYSQFNQDISNWNVSSVIGMGRMFYRNRYFNQDLSGWCVLQIPSKPYYFDEYARRWSLPRPVWGTCP